MQCSRGQKHSSPSGGCSNEARKGSRRRQQKLTNTAAAGKRQNEAILNEDQVKRLYAVMHEQLEVHGTGNFPTLFIGLRRFINCVTRRLHDKGLQVNRVKLNGSAASYVLATKLLPYNDVDLIFDVDMSSSLALRDDLSMKFDIIKHSVFESLIEFLPQDVNRSKISAGAMKVAYVRKMVKVCDVDSQSRKVRGDLWSLISLNNDQGRFLELKFVDRMRRQFEFSVDSFQIDLEPIVQRDKVSLHNGQSTEEQSVEIPSLKDYCNEDNSLRITAESLYGNFHLALKHLNNMLIDTVQPELIRGGGLLKYVNLLVKGYRPACSARECYRMERYMCSRFFIDFNSWEQQQQKLRTYLETHFQTSLLAKFDFLRTLYSIVDESTVCLMNHELRMSLSCIEQLIVELHLQLYYEQQMALIGETTAFTYLSPVSLNVFDFRPPRRPSSAASTATSGTFQTLQSTGPSDAENHNGSSLTKDKERASVSCPNPDNLSNEPKFRKSTLLYVPPNAAYWVPVM